MIPDLVSIVIPVHNRPVLLREAIDSVRTQTWRPIEIVVVDDGSTDETVQVARSLVCEGNGLSIRLLTQTNSGPGVARQRGVESCRGEYVGFCDSDDLYLPEKLSVQVKALRDHPEAGIAYGRTLLENDGVRVHSPENWSGRKVDRLFPALLTGRLWDTSNPLYRRSALDRIGPWAARRQLEDWEFDCRAAREGIVPIHCDADLSVHRAHSGAGLFDAWRSDLSALRDRIWAYEQALAYAVEARLDRHGEEWQKFLRSFFLMARIAGKRGLSSDATRLFNSLRAVSQTNRLELFVFNAMIRGLGWRRTVEVAERVFKKNTG